MANEDGRVFRGAQIVQIGSGVANPRAGVKGVIDDLGMGAELGYISIPVLLENGAELDL